MPVCSPPRVAGGLPRKRGVAAAEMALCLPLIVLLVLASLEACSMIFLNHGLAIASYESVRIAINYDGTNADVTSRYQEIIDSRNIEDATIQLNPVDCSQVPRGETIAVTVSAPCDSNALIPPWFFGGQTLFSTTTMVKE